jgi:hypothetical protein
VLSNDPTPQRKLSQDARDVCSHTVTEFYVQLLAKSGLRQLDGVALKELLLRSSSAEKSLRALREEVAALRLVAERETRNDYYRRLFREVQGSISDLETAQSDFRYLTEPNSKIRDAASLRGARQRLVSARVVLEAQAKELSDPELRARVLAFVLEDEKQDRILKHGASDNEEFEAVRSATIWAYSDAQNAVAEALRSLGDTS